MLEVIPALAQMAGMMAGFRLSRAVYAVSALGIADLLRDGPLTCDQLAAACEAHSPSLYRVMRALAAAGFFHEDAEGRFSLTPVGTTLCSDAAQTLLPTALELGSDRQWEMWGKLFESVCTGEAAWNRLHGSDFSDSCVTDPQLGQAVSAARTSIYIPSDEAIIEAYDFSPYHCVASVG